MNSRFFDNFFNGSGGGKQNVEWVDEVSGAVVEYHTTNVCYTNLHRYIKKSKYHME